MNTRGYSAYNLARGALLNSRLTLADSGNQPLKLLDIVVSGMGMDPTAGLWLTPLHAIPAVPRVFPFDLIYLDKEYRVLATAEMGPGIEFPAFHAEVASALVLPSDTLRRTHTALGDCMIVCLSNELETLLAASSLPSPDAAEAVHKSAASETLSAGMPTHAGVIEITPEKPSLAASSPPNAFEQSIFTAVAKVAETRYSLEAKPAARQESPNQGPSIAITEAVLDPFRRIQPAIIEHHVDPEDLFSNWVVSAPPAPRKGAIDPPEAPALTKPEISTPESGPEPARQNGRKSVSAKPAPETPEQPRAASIASSSPRVQSRVKTSSETSDKPTQPARSRTSPSFKTDAPLNAPPAAPPTPPATTFTAVPYGMWQVSMPTAIPPVTGVKSPERARPAPTPDSGNSTKQPAKAAVVAPPTVRSPDPPTDPKIQAAPDLAPKSQASTEPAPPRTEEIMTAPKPVIRDATGSDVQRPGDFVASLQEKLQRVQQSKPAPVAPATGPQQSDAAKTAAAPSPKSKPSPSVPAKPKAEPSLGGLRLKFKQWLHPVSSPSDRRRAARRYVPGMIAHYFTGGAPKPKDVADISMSGMYLLTDDRWMPGTMIQMTLQKPCARGEKKQSINVLSRIVRRGSDGVAAEFIMPEALNRISHDIQPSQATDKFALARFL